jgi:predicted AAA+ superfamily ATPase
MEMIDRFFTPPQGSFFLFGPRGTGKSTFVKQRFKDALYVDLLEPDVFRRFSANPEYLGERVRAEGERAVVIIDEIQKVPQLLSLVHRLIEEKKGRRFILTGSSSRNLKRSGVDLLAGRALLCWLHPFVAAELGLRFSLEQSLQKGLLPVVWGSPEPERVLQSYAALYLKEEVQLEGLVRNIGNFSRFIEAISFSHASLLNISNVARECEVERKVVDGYVDVLVDLLLAFRLPVFSKRAQRALVKHPKFYLFDAGVFRALRPRGPLDRSEEIEGHALEGLVAHHLRAWVDYSEPEQALYFWRTRAGNEVDFVIYGEEGLFALEVKNAARIHSKDLRSLKSFRQDYPESKTYLLYRGKERLIKDEILCLPCEEFLSGLRPGRWFD